MRLTAAGVTVVLGGTTIVEDTALDVGDGEVVGLLGPNGSGKSTLLRCAYRALRPRTGVVAFDDRDVWDLPARSAAQQVAVVVQEASGDFDLTVDEVVRLGRLPHKGLLERDSAADQDRVQAALHRVGLGRLVHRAYPTLSGGEKQRVLLARALVQETPLLILDEPTNHLDIGHQLEMLDLVRGLGVSTLTALHDLNLAAAYCDRLYVLHEGRVTASGTPAQVLHPDLLAEVFGVGASVVTNPVTGHLHVTFHPLPRTPQPLDRGDLPRAATTSADR